MLQNSNNTRNIIVFLCIILCATGRFAEESPSVTECQSHIDKAVNKYKNINHESSESDKNIECVDASKEHCFSISREEEKTVNTKNDNKLDHDFKELQNSDVDKISQYTLLQDQIETQESQLDNDEEQGQQGDAEKEDDTDDDDIHSTIDTHEDDIQDQEEGSHQQGDYEEEEDIDDDNIHSTNDTYEDDILDQDELSLQQGDPKNKDDADDDNIYSKNETHEDETEDQDEGSLQEGDSQPEENNDDYNIHSANEDGKEDQTEESVQQDDSEKGEAIGDDNINPTNETPEDETLDLELEERPLQVENILSREVEIDDEANTNPEEDLTLEFKIPTELRHKEHIVELLHLNSFSDKDTAIEKCSSSILHELKQIYETSIKPLEQLYKYRDLSNRHFGDAEIFAKPLIVFMGPWSGGKSTILNYLTDNEYTSFSIRSGAEPSPTQFNILMHGNDTEILDGTQIAADWTFSGLQKFGQSFLDRLKAIKMPNPLLEKVNIVEIPGILEARKHLSRSFPFNDACQWFIDRADLIFLVYDPSKLDVGPETEAVLDQLKGREYQTRILLNKADQVKPEELLRVQNALIWNISPLMSSVQPPLLYTVSLWSHPYEIGAPIRLLQAQEKAFLMDIRDAIDKRIENKIASARRFAVRVRNHAKMIDCYLTTYYNHKSLFGNKNEIAKHIIENPQQYHIYEGLSTLTNISRYDLPDPEVYREFFYLNNLYTFKRLSETCTYFHGCPINKLDIAIAYDLPDLIGKYKRKLVNIQ